MRFVFADPREVEEAVISMSGCRRESIQVRMIKSLHSNLVAALENYMRRLVEYKTVCRAIEESVAPISQKNKNCQDGVHFDGAPPFCNECAYCRLNKWDSVTFAKNNLVDLAEELATKYTECQSIARARRIQASLNGTEYTEFSPHSPYEESWEGRE